MKVDSSIYTNNKSFTDLKQVAGHRFCYLQCRPEMNASEWTNQ